MMWASNKPPRANSSGIPSSPTNSSRLGSFFGLVRILLKPGLTLLSNNECFASDIHALSSYCIAYYMILDTKLRRLSWWQLSSSACLVLIIRFLGTSISSYAYEIKQDIHRHCSPHT